jgi:hypothetical protein
VSSRCAATRAEAGDLGSQFIAVRVRFDGTWPYLVQTAYFLAWPTLGSAILILGDPGYDKQLKVSEAHTQSPLACPPLPSHK